MTMRNYRDEDDRDADSWEPWMAAPTPVPTHTCTPARYDAAPKMVDAFSRLAAERQSLLNDPQASVGVYAEVMQQYEDSFSMLVALVRGEAFDPLLPPTPE